MKFYPALLSDSVQEIQHQLLLAQSFDEVEVVQIDVLDGQFADNMTVTPLDLINLDYGDLELDFHLMVEEPMNYIHEILDCQDQLPLRAVVAHVERMSHQNEVLQELKKNKLQAGLSLDLFTPIEALDLTAAEDIDVIQLMGVEAGFQGQTLNAHIFDKLRELDQWLDQHQLSVEVIVDGGVKIEHLSDLKKLGVDAVAVGSLLWESDDPQKIVQQIIKSD